MQDIKDMVQCCLTADRKFIKTFGKNFRLQPMGSTTAGFTRNGQDFFTTFGSYHVQSDREQGTISLVATHEGLQTLELHLDEDDTRDISIVQLPKLKSSSSSSSSSSSASSGTTTNDVGDEHADHDDDDDENRSQTTNATAVDTTCGDDEACETGGSVRGDDDDDSLCPAARVSYMNLKGGSNHDDDDENESCVSDDSSLRDARYRLAHISVTKPVSPPAPRRRKETKPASPQSLLRKEQRQQSRDIPLVINTASSEADMPSELMKCAKPVDDTYNSDEEEEEENGNEERPVEDHDDDGDVDDDDDDSSTNPFASSGEFDFSMADDDDESSDDDSDKRDVRCQQRRQSAGYY
jgi:hypothetical protein